MDKELVRVEGRSVRFIDGEGQYWEVANVLRKELGVSNTKLVQALEGVTGIAIVGRKNRQLILYQENEVRERLSDFLALPLADDNTKKFVDQDGQSWVTIDFLIKSFGISRRTLLKQLNGIGQITGRAGNGHLTTLYNEQEASIVLSQLLALPSVDKDTKKYTDSDNQSWLSIDYFHIRFGLGHKLLAHLLMGVSSVTGKAGSGRVAQLYNEAQAKALIEQFVTLPKVDRKTNVYTDGLGERWSSANNLLTRLRVYSKVALDALLTADSIEGRDAYGHKITLYKESDVLGKLTTHPELSPVDSGQANSDLERLLEGSDE